MDGGMDHGTEEEGTERTASVDRDEMDSVLLAHAAAARKQNFKTMAIEATEVSLPSLHRDHFQNSG